MCLETLTWKQFTWKDALESKKTVLFFGHTHGMLEVPRPGS